MRVREPMGARCTRPARTTAVLALSLVLMASAQVEFAAATPTTEVRTVAGPGFVAAATTVVSATADTGVAPTVHELAVPTVPRAERAETAESTGSRAALVAKSALPKSAAASPSLVAHVEAPVAGGFSMLGVTWSRTGDLSRAAAPVVAVRTKKGGGWSRWTEASVDPDEGPAAAEESGARDGTAPIFVGEADAVEVDVYTASGTAPADLEVAAIDPGTTPTATSLSKGATVGTEVTRPTRDRFPSLPRIVTRRGWGADERLGDQCWAPRYGRTFKAVFVHHTAGSNNYTRRESPGDRAWHLRVPHPVPRLVRHRLQLPGRPLRHDLRGTRGRHPPAGARRPRRRLQRQHHRHLADGQLHLGHADEGDAARR